LNKYKPKMFEYPKSSNIMWRTYGSPKLEAEVWSSGLYELYIVEGENRIQVNSAKVQEFYFAKHAAQLNEEKSFRE
jgi:hypothetical protein